MQQQLFPQLEQLAARVQDKCEARELANIIWACGYLQLLHTAELLLPTFTKQLQAAKPQHISNTLWAVAKLEHQPSAEQLQNLLPTFIKQLGAANPQEISTALWAAATLGLQPAAAQGQQLLPAFLQKLSAANPQDVSFTMWAAAKLQLQLSTQQLAACETEFTRKLQAANTQNVANMLWACAEQRYYPQQLLAGLKQQQQEPWLQQLLVKTPLVNISGIAYACGSLGYSDAVLISALLQQAVARSQSGALQHDSLQWDLPNLCWQRQCWTSSSLSVCKPCCSWLPHVLEGGAAWWLKQSSSCTRCTCG